jgi:CheY-like chemotaxis protein
MGALESKSFMREEADLVTFIAPDFRVLIVDDNAANLKVTTGLLAPYKMTTDACLSGKDALALVQKHDYGLVLLDQMMQGMDGIETLAAIRALGGRFEKLPVVAFTANAMSGMREFFLSKGFDDYLSKPIELPKLNELIESRVPAEKRRKPECLENAPEARLESRVAGNAEADAALAMPGITRAELAAQRLDMLGHYRWHFANGFPADQAYYENFCALVEAMDAPPSLRGEMASLAAAGRQGDGETIQRLLPGAYEALAAAVASRAQDAPPSVIFDQTLRRLKAALDADDGQSADAVMDELRDMDDLSNDARELYCFLNDALLMGETGKASQKLAEWLKS